MADKEKEIDQLLDSDYDGIQEYDNDLPRWWLNIFWLTTIFAIGYTIYVHGGFAPTDAEKIAMEIQELDSKKAELRKEEEKNAPEVTEESLLALVSVPERVSTGEAVYKEKCAVCHGQVGEGLIGPNLTDDNWIHGGSLMEIREILHKGVLEKGMLAWEGVIPEEDIQSVVAYIRSIRGTNPPNAKAAEGELYTP